MNKRPWAAATVGVFLLVAGSVAAATVSEELAAGACTVAMWRLGMDAMDDAGRKLLAFALAVDPANERANRLQQGLDGGEAIPGTPLPDAGRTYVSYLEKVAAGSRSRRHRILLYKVIELVQPEHEKARQELEQAREKGADTAFEALLAAVVGSSPEHGAEDAPEGPGEAEDALRAAMPLSGSSRLVQVFLDTPLLVVNRMNEILRPSGFAVRVTSRTRRPVASSMDEGRVYYSGGNFGCRRLRPHGALPAELPEPVSAWQLLMLLAACHDLAWHTDGHVVELIDLDEAPERGATIPMAAAGLVETMKAGRVDFLNQYRGRRMLVHGLVSGIGRSKPPYVHLAGDAVRVVLDTGTAAESLEGISAAYQQVTKLGRERPRGGISTYQGTAYGGSPVLLFVCEATCDGMMRGRLIFKECRDCISLPLAQPESGR
ncbi:MAG: hypothetical protein JXR77_17205 [Lentisphaeria bacterium]|nr:hypothetical protein [Lentisphaeria bacterium]